MDEQRLLLLIVIMKTRLDACKDIVGLKANDVVEEAPELVNFRFDFDDWASVLLHKVNVVSNFYL